MFTPRPWGLVLGSLNLPSLPSSTPSPPPAPTPEEILDLPFTRDARVLHPRGHLPPHSPLLESQHPCSKAKSGRNVTLNRNVRWRRGRVV